MTEPSLSEIASGLEQANHKLDRLDDGLKQVVLWLTGDGTPEAGMLWQMADMHRELGRRGNGSGWNRLAFEVARAAAGNVLTITALGLIGLLILGARVSIGLSP